MKPSILGKLSGFQWVVLLRAVLVLLLVVAASYLSLQNIALKKQLSQKAFLARRVIGCTIEGLAGTDSQGKSRSITFPVEKPLLLITAKRDCIYCEQSWSSWDKLAQTLVSQVEPIVLNIADELPNDYINRFSLGHYTILQANVAPRSLQAYGAPTPSVLLISRTGVLIGRWTGQLSERIVEDVIMQVKSSN